jgi:ribonucleoside-diphosphate reductase beta chain
MWRKMIANKWEADQVILQRDKSEFKKLSKKQQQAFKRALAFLSNLDSIQCENLMMNVTPFITDPDVQKLLARQQLEEWIHVETYSTIIESIFEDPLEIYDMYRHNPLLSSKNDYITYQGAQVSLTPTPQNKVKAIVSNMALEGVYFFNGFSTFYALNRASGGINGSVDGIKYIERDEKTHLEIFANIFNSLRAERPELFTKELLEECKGIFKEAAQREALWGKYVIDGGIPELTDTIMEEYPKFRAEECANTIGLSVFPKARNPIPWVDDYSGKTKANFFESKPTSYSEAKPQFSRRKAAS